MTRVGLVACAASKLAAAAPARHLYTSQLFRKASTYAARNTDLWFILSAEHGLVAPDTVLEPYDTRLGTKGAPPIAVWAERVNRQLAGALVGVTDPHLVVLAGAQYRTILQGSPYPYTVPMEGLGIGQQLGWLTRALDPEPRPSDGPDFHAEHAAWAARQAR